MIEQDPAQAALALARDAPVNWGGEALVIVLPETSLAQGIEVRAPRGWPVAHARYTSPISSFRCMRRKQTMASVTLSQDLKRYGTTRVVHGVDISIADGEFCVLVGPSGCGQSTLLRRVAGLEAISGGTVPIDDKSSTICRQKSAMWQWWFRATRCIPA